MPSYSTPALFIDFSRLPPPKVIEEIDYEKLLKVYQDQVVAKLPSLASAVKLEQSPTNVVLEAEAYGEMIVRARINAAARAVMLPFATGSDLDVLAAFFNVQRMTVPEDLTTTPITPAQPETDARLRRRAQLAAEALTTAGSEGAYIFHALAADPTVRDASAVMTTPGHVQVAVMADGTEPVPTEGQLAAVRSVLHMPRIKPLTDVVSVVPAERIDVAVVANLTLYPGPDAALVMADVNAALTRLRARIALLGYDLTRAALISALYHEGVQDVDLISPATDVAADAHQCVWITSATANILSNRLE